MLIVHYYRSNTHQHTLSAQVDTMYHSLNGQLFSNHHYNQSHMKTVQRRINLSYLLAAPRVREHVRMSYS